MGWKCLLLQAAEIQLCLIISHYKHLEMSGRKPALLHFFMEGKKKKKADLGTLQVPGEQQRIKFKINRQ